MSGPPDERIFFVPLQPVFVEKPRGAASFLLFGQLGIASSVMWPFQERHPFCFFARPDPGKGFHGGPAFFRNAGTETAAARPDPLSMVVESEKWVIV